MTVEQLCAGRVCAITGAGRGIGREYALMLAAHGAAVLVNDLGVGLDGGGRDTSPAAEVVAAIEAAGGRAAVNTDDVADWNGAEGLVQQAIDTFGQLDVLITNAGILRDRMLVNMEPAEWDAVIHVHLRGTFAPARFAARHWRERSKAGETVDGRLITTTSASGLFASPGQANYAAAKAGIAALTQVAAQELARYGVTANSIAPRAITRMTEALASGNDLKERFGPEWIAAVCTWLASPLSSDVTGQVFEADGALLSVAEGWRRGPAGAPVRDPRGVDAVIRKLLAEATPRTTVADIPRLTAQA